MSRTVLLYFEPFPEHWYLSLKTGPKPHLHIPASVVLDLKQTHCMRTLIHQSCQKRKTENSGQFPACSWNIWNPDSLMSIIRGARALWYFPIPERSRDSGEAQRDERTELLSNSEHGLFRARYSGYMHSDQQIRRGTNMPWIFYWRATF